MVLIKPCSSIQLLLHLLRQASLQNRLLLPVAQLLHLRLGIPMLVLSPQPVLRHLQELRSRQAVRPRQEELVPRCLWPRALGLGLHLQPHLTLAECPSRLHLAALRILVHLVARATRREQFPSSLVVQWSLLSLGHLLPISLPPFSCPAPCW